MDPSSSAPPYSEKEIRCPKLGHMITFDYCRRESAPLPCGKAIGCWSIHFDVETFFRQTLCVDEFAGAFSTPPQSKVVTLMELIEQAKRTLEKKHAGERDAPLKKDRGGESCDEQ